jgi:small-conductance mechanosensitive channel
MDASPIALVGIPVVDALLLLAGAALLGVGGYALLHRLVRTVTRRASWNVPLRRILLDRIRMPMRLLVPVLCMMATRPVVAPLLANTGLAVLRGSLHVGLVLAVTWLILAGLAAAEQAITEHHALDTEDNLRARKIVTQARILRRIASTIIVIVALGVVLLEYQAFREVGAGILASAGIFGIIFGIAAQKTLGNLIAGIQIAFTQPFRVDDVVIVEGEFGWVEEITLTYVVVRVWDRRRIVMPITHFIEQPFQNWTRSSSDLIGAVFLYVDYTTPVDALREELQRIVEASAHWDGDVAGLQMTDASERTATLRVIASAKNAPELWNLRCEIREKLVAYIRDHHPEALPALRMQPHTSDGMPYAAPE